MAMASQMNQHSARRGTLVHVYTQDGVELAVDDNGARSGGHTVVFLHGWCLSRASWSRQIDFLLRRGGAVRVISYDHRGHGQSGSAAMDSYAVNRLAEDLAVVLDTLEVTGPLTLVGHSLGGMVALAYLARPAHDRPIDPCDLILIATAAGNLAHLGLGRLLKTPAVTSALLDLIVRIPEHTLRPFTTVLRTALNRLSGHGNAQHRALTAAAAAALATTPTATALGFLPSLRTYDQYPVLETIQARTVIVSGGADFLTPPAHADDLAAAIPKSRHIHLPRCGHMLPQQAPDAINAIIAHAGVAPAVREIPA